MKINDYEIAGAPQDLIDFKDQVTLLLNNGKYSAIVVGTPPTWTGRNGEFVFFNSSGNLRIYLYNNTSWGFIEYPAGGGALITAVSNNVTTVSSTLLNVSNNLAAVSNNLTTASSTLLNVSNNAVAISNNVVTGSTTLLNVSNNLVAVSNNVVTGSTTLLNVSNNLVAVSNNVVTGSTTLLNVSNNLVAVSNNVVTGSTTLLNVSNNLVAVSNNVVTGSTTLLNVSNNSVAVSNNVVTGSTTLLNVSNNLITVSNNQATEVTRVTNVSNNLVTASGNIANLIVQATNGGLKGWINFSGTGALSIDDHYNVAALTRHTTGQYSVIWTTTNANNFSAPAGLARLDNSNLIVMVLSSLQLGSTRVAFINQSDVKVDPVVASLMSTGDQ